MDSSRGAVRQHRQAEHRDRVETGGRERDAAHDPGATEAGAEADQHTGHELEDDDRGKDERPVLGRGAGRDQRDQDDRGGVVEAGLRLEGTGDPPRQRHHADHREHGGRVGRRRHRAEEYGELPRHAEEVVGADRDDADRDRHPDRRERQAEPDRAPGLPPVRGEATFGQDDREGAESECVRDLGVLEGDTDQGLPEHHADEQVDEKAREPGAGGDAHREHRDEGDGRPHQQERVELMDVETHVTSAAVVGARVRSLSAHSSERRWPQTETCSTFGP